MSEPNIPTVEPDIDQARRESHSQVPRTDNSDSLTRHPITSDNLGKVNLFCHWANREI
ncbi:hypothetical protein X946_3618 [Burkholderia sp. ABCPW 111]|nr:hypothetical protein X946_3618 [Burkholderia sp. ABCPW 111]